MDRAHPILNEKDFSIFTKSVCEAKIAKKNQHDWETKTANYRMNQAIQRSKSEAGFCQDRGTQDQIEYELCWAYQSAIILEQANPKTEQNLDF